MRALSRRDFLKRTAAGSMYAAASALFPRVLSSDEREDSTQATGAGSVPDVDILLRARQGQAEIMAGVPTPVLSYEGLLLSGPKDTLFNMEGSYLGPIITLRRGQRVRIRFENGIGEESIVHWHGLHVPPDADGHPRFAVRSGKEYRYEFTVTDRAGTYWYHPHPHRRTGPQVYFGLAGLLIVTDEEERSLDLPSGSRDIPLVIQDRLFGDRGRLVYLQGPMRGAMMGFLGDRIVVNGRADYVKCVERGTFRLRVLNGSNSRIYKLAWGDRTPLTVIGTDGGLLERAVTKPYLMMGPGERADLWVDFSQDEIGGRRYLVSLPFTDPMTLRGGGMGMRGNRGMMDRGGGFANGLPNGTGFTIMAFQVGSGGGKAVSLPKHLSNIIRPQAEEAINASRPKEFHFSMQHMQPTINGRLFDMQGVSQEEIVRLDTNEIWDFINDNRSMMGMPMPHPVHMHGLQFTVLQRRVDPVFYGMWETVREGFVDQGLKDTVLLMPGTSARVIVSFRDFEGLYLYHCHNLEHEDLGMMRNYLVQA